VDREKWSEFVELCHQCEKCGLSLTRNHVVIGRGNPETAKIIFIGEGPGEQEDLTGLPFVGPGGKLLDLLLSALRFHEEDYYIANIVKCRPPGNRDPHQEEITTCIPWLRWQVRAIQPAIIVCLGRIAAITIIDKDCKITKARGNWLVRGDYHIMPTWHPAAVLRDPDKKISWFDDMKKVKQKLDEISR